MKDVGQHHLHTDERQLQGQATFQVVELAHHVRKHEVQRAQAQNREDVGCIDNKWVCTDRENGGNRVQGENQIRGLDHQQHQQERRGQHLPRSPHKKAITFKVGSDRNHPTHKLQHRIALWMHRLVFVEGHADARHDQESPEQVENPVEIFEQHSAKDNQDAAHDERTQNTPEQHPVLIGCRYTEVAEEQHKDEDVVNAEGLLDQIARHELQRQFRSTEEVDSSVEEQRQCNPHGTPYRGLTDRDGMRLAVKDTQVAYEHRTNE